MATKKKWDPKDPADIANYWFDWSEFLLKASEAAGVPITIASQVVDVPAEIDLVESDFNGPTSMVRAMMGGGVDKVDYAIDSTITASTGEVFQMTSVLKVRERIVK